MLSDDDRRTLLELARRAAQAAARSERTPDLTNPSGALREKGAAFVSLRIDGRLRGCMGHIRAVAPLWESVREMAAAAAERDGRFPVLRPEELPRLAVEISVLSPMEPIRPEDVRVGLHGLYVQSNPHAGLLLPKVAAEQGWDVATLLRETYGKAGLPPGAPGARLYGFTTETFQEGPSKVSTKSPDR